MYRQYFVYILANRTNKVLYIGLTNNIFRRVQEHRQGKIIGFTSKYKVNKLIYLEVYEYVYDALEREKQLKRWHRAWKIELINKFNKDWVDLGNVWFQYPDEQNHRNVRDAEKRP